MIYSGLGYILLAEINLYLNSTQHRNRWECKICDQWASTDRIILTSEMWTLAYRSTIRLLKNAQLCSTQLCSTAHTSGDLEVSRCTGWWLGTLSLQAESRLATLTFWSRLGLVTDALFVWDAGDKDVEGSLGQILLHRVWWKQTLGVFPLFMLALAMGQFIWLPGDRTHALAGVGTSSGKRNNTILSLCQDLHSRWISLKRISGQSILFSCHRTQLWAVSYSRIKV